MASLAHFSPEEKVALAIAAAAHVVLLAVLMLQGAGNVRVPKPERITVSLASKVSLRSTAPDVSKQPAAAHAPKLAATVAPEPVPPVKVPQPKPLPIPKPVREATKPAKPEKVKPREKHKPAHKTPAREKPREQPKKQSAAPRLGKNFLKGLSDSTGTKGSPAQQVGPVQQAAIRQAIIRQLKPYWNPPAGLDVDKLVTTLRFHLNRDGSLAGDPQVVRTTGITAANRAQVARHQEQAIRAVRLAAPFHLPEQYYSAWSVVTSNFDKSLSQ